MTPGTLSIPWIAIVPSWSGERTPKSLTRFWTSSQVDEFAGGDWAFPSTRELPTASPFTDDDHFGCERGHSCSVASDASTSSVITGVDSPSQIPTADSKILRKSSSAASPDECDNWHPDSNRDKTGAAAPITSEAFIVDAALNHSSIRALSNTTYL